MTDTEIKAQRKAFEETAKTAFKDSFDKIAVSALLDTLYSKTLDYSYSEREELTEIILNEARKAKRYRECKKYIDDYMIEYRNKLLDECTTGYAEITGMPPNCTFLAFNDYKCGKYIVNDCGVFKPIITRDGTVNREMLCSQPLLITEKLRNLQDGREKLVLAYFDCNKWRNITIDREVISNSFKAVQLSNYGIDITSETAKSIINYLQLILRENMDIIPLTNTICRVGWYEGEFVPYSSVIKCDAVDNFRDVYNAITEQGSFEEWRAHCYKLRENLPLRLTMAASFAAPIIILTGGLPFILHLWGETEFGKSVTLKVAASVWGNHNGLYRSLNTTNYAVSEISAFLYSLPCILDELQTIKDTRGGYDRFVMQCTEGVGRMQGSESGGIRKTKTWENCFITNGEESIVKDNSGGGAVNRVISIGVTDLIIQDGDTTMNIISNNYGHAGKAFIKGLQNEQDISEQRRQIYKELMQDKEVTSKQCLAMSFLLLADKIACKYIFTDEEPLRTEQVTQFLRKKKDVDISVRCLEWLHNWVSANLKRFETSSLNNGEIWGRIDDDCILINKNILYEHLNEAGFPHEAILPKLARKGYILKYGGNRFVHRTSINNKKGYFIKLAKDHKDWEELDEKTPFED